MTHYMSCVWGGEGEGIQGGEPMTLVLITKWYKTVSVFSYAKEK